MKISSETLLHAPVTSPRPQSTGVGAESASVFSLRMEDTERSSGSMPVWQKAQTPREQVMADISAAGETEADVLSLRDSGATDKPSEEFGFFDLLDMINPLQHIPVVGTLYRSLTGDEIKPIAQIIGGTVFGGPLGAAGGIANAIVQEETGKDIGGNILGMFGSGQANTPSSEADPTDTTIAVAALAYRQPAYNN